MSTSVGATGAAQAMRVKGISVPDLAAATSSDGPKGTIRASRRARVRPELCRRRGREVHAIPGQDQRSGKAKLFAKSEGCGGPLPRPRPVDAYVSGGPERRLKIKRAKATLAKPAAEVLSEAFDFPFRKGIPFGTMNDQGGAVELIAASAARNFERAPLLIGQSASPPSLRQGARGSPKAAPSMGCRRCAAAGPGVRSRPACSGTVLDSAACPGTPSGRRSSTRRRPPTPSAASCSRSSRARSRRRA